MMQPLHYASWRKQLRHSCSYSVWVVPETVTPFRAVNSGSTHYCRSWLASHELV